MIIRNVLNCLKFVFAADSARWVNGYSSSPFSLGEFFVGLEANMVWLDPVIDLLGDLFLQCLPLHHLLVHENLLDKDLRETLLELVVSVPDGRRVLAVVDLRASWWRAVFTRGLVTMAHIKSEH